jgi:hypothetical protein
MTAPQYYMYNYQTPAGLNAVGDSFVSSAQGDLDGNGALSLFSLYGKIQDGGPRGGWVLTLAPSIEEQNPDD